MSSKELQEAEAIAQIHQLGIRPGSLPLGHGDVPAEKCPVCAAVLATVALRDSCSYPDEGKDWIGPQKERGDFGVAFCPGCGPGYLFSNLPGNRVWCPRCERVEAKEAR